MDINEHIHIEPYNPKWSLDYTNEVKRLKSDQALSDFRFEHIGSTSIPGIKAKPIVDILIGVKSFPVTNNIIEALEKKGYIYMQKGSVADRLYFIKRGRVNYNAQVVVYGSRIWTDDLIFRDYLTAHRDKAMEYQRIKEQIIGNGITTLIEYSAQKAEFIAAIYREIYAAVLSDCKSL